MNTLSPPENRQTIMEDSATLLNQVVERAVKIKRPQLFHQLVWRLKGIFRPKPFWRIWVGKQIYQFARAVEFFGLAFLKPEDLIESNRRYYEASGQVKRYTNQEIMKLAPLEMQVFEGFVRPRLRGKALVLGCGGGREMHALAQQGWEVVGIDQSASLICEAEKSFNESSKASWYYRDISQGIRLGDHFDFICLWCSVYNLIPTKKRRIQLLKDCRAHLKPDGICSLSFNTVFTLPSRTKRWAHTWRKGFAWMTGGNLDCEIGGRWQAGHFFHQFSSTEEAIEETRLAGFDLIWVNAKVGQGILVLTPINK